MRGLLLGLWASYRWGGPRAVPVRAGGTANGTSKHHVTKESRVFSRAVVLEGRGKAMDEFLFKGKGRRKGKTCGGGPPVKKTIREEKRSTKRQQQKQEEEEPSVPHVLQGRPHPAEQLGRLLRSVSSPVLRPNEPHGQSDSTSSILFVA